MKYILYRSFGSIDKDVRKHWQFLPEFRQLLSIRRMFLCSMYPDSFAEYQNKALRLLIDSG